MPKKNESLKEEKQTKIRHFQGNTDERPQKYKREKTRLDQQKSMERYRKKIAVKIRWALLRPEMGYLAGRKIRCGTVALLLIVYTFIEQEGKAILRIDHGGEIIP